MTIKLIAMDMDDTLLDEHAAGDGTNAGSNPAGDGRRRGRDDRHRTDVPVGVAVCAGTGDSIAV